MNRKALIISVALIALILIGTSLYFILRSPEKTVDTQVSDISFTGFGEDTAANPRILGGQDACADAANLFERRDCLDHAGAPTSTAADIQSPASFGSNTTAASYQSALEKMFAPQTAGTITPTQSVAAPPPDEDISPSSASNPETALRYSVSFGAPLAVYAASKYQALPGQHIKIYGGGFTSTGNTLSFSGTDSILSSADGATLEAVAPGATGEYEIWVTNAKGSSRVGARPVKITVTDSPMPLPVIFSASPSPVSLGGTVELSGKNFGPSNTLLTSLGVLQNVMSSDGATLRFAISSLPYLSYAQNAADLKGKIVPISVNIQTSAGVTEQIFQFNVQF